MRVIKTVLIATVISLSIVYIPSCVSHKPGGNAMVRQDNGVPVTGIADQSAVPASPRVKTRADLRSTLECAKKSNIAMECEMKVLSSGAAVAMPMVAKCMVQAGSGYVAPPPPSYNTEEYDPIEENGFKQTASEPLSTFSIDVDKASYANIRRFLTGSTLPPTDAVRIEEMINYFTYTYPQPQDEHPFSITTELGACPWDKTHHLALIGIKGKVIETANLPPSNLVFLLDVSGSMASPDKLPLIQSAMKMLVDNLRASDHIAIAVYAGAAGLVLPSTPGDCKNAIKNAIDNLSAGGSTAGSEGIELAYATAKRNFIEGGNNRVILATDGDFNVGTSSDAELVRLIEEKRKDGIFLTVLGFGTGNYKDAKMMKLADKGNGNYAYIDNLLEAKKVLVSEMGGTLLTIAKDVKIQVEFNPAVVAGYRLVGYEKRRLNNEDFNDDAKDAGELGSGHCVTALYEIVPAGAEVPAVKTDDLKYQSTRTVSGDNGELLTVKFRYKQPQGSESMLITRTLGTSVSSNAGENFRFASAVAGFGMLLRDSKQCGDLTFSAVRTQAQNACGNDADGYRAEFIRLVETAEMLKKNNL